MEGLMLRNNNNVDSLAQWQTPVIFVDLKSNQNNLCYATV